MMRKRNTARMPVPALAGTLVATTASLIFVSLALAGQSPVPRGDANCSGGVNSLDVTMVLMASGGLLAEVSCPARADVDADGAVTSRDAALILQIEAGLWSAVAPTPESPEDRGDLTTYLQLGDLPNNEGIFVSLTLLNNNSWPIKRGYLDGQDYDVVVRDANGAYVWNYWHDTPWTQAAESRVWEPGEWVTYNATWRFEDKEGNQVAPGTYQLQALDVGCTTDPVRQCDLGEPVAVDIPPPRDCAGQDGLVTDLLVSGGNETFAPRENVSLTLSLFNCGETSVTRAYSSSHQYDFAVRDSSGQVLWHWSHGWVFTQVKTELTVDPGEMITRRAVWRQETDERPLFPPDLLKGGDPVPPGTYEAFGLWCGLSNVALSDLNACDAKVGQTVEVAP